MTSPQYDYNGERHGDEPTPCERLTGLDHRALAILAVFWISAVALFLTFWR